MENRTQSLNENFQTHIVPIVADIDAGFGNAEATYLLAKKMILAGACALQIENQVSDEKQCGHQDGKVTVPHDVFLAKVRACRYAFLELGVEEGVIVTRTDSLGANLLTSDVDPRDEEFITGERSPEGFYYVQPGIEQAVARGLAYAPYADLIWCETATPDLEEARIFAERIREQHPDKLLAYNCSPSFNWRKHLDDDTIAKFQRELGAMGYAFQFVTLAGWHALNESTFALARGYAERGMSAYVELQQREFALEDAGYPIVFTVHDEIVVEHSDIARETIERIMSERPPWAVRLGVPVKAKAWVGKRYRK